MLLAYSGSCMLTVQDKKISYLLGEFCTRNGVEKIGGEFMVDIAVNKTYYITYLPTVRWILYDLNFM
jgi:hypothetical protein